jgi:hypothetical protein
MPEEVMTPQGAILNEAAGKVREAAELLEEAKGWVPFADAQKIDAVAVGCYSIENDLGNRAYGEVVY